MSRPVLYDYYRSSAAYRVRIALNLKGIGYDSVPVNLAGGAHRDAEYRARNPQGFVPMLQMDGLKLTQSLAIVDYLDAAVPEPRLVSPDPAERAQVLAMALTIACDIHPLNNLRVLQYLTGPLGHDEAAKGEWIARWIGDGFAALEVLAAARVGRFLSGEAPGLADICLVPQMYNARRFGVSVGDYPRLVAADAAACALEPFAAAHPDRVAPSA